LGFSASYPSGVSTRFCLQIGMIPRCEQSFGTPHVCDRGLEGIVAKRRSGKYRSGYRGWVKVKNPGYWGRESEVEGIRRSHERRARASTAAF
jgi:hypothetical protein